ncbi:MAG: hypothetical protein A2Z34_00060 [Planctomycetes bacterium RBG_16_59_8]|nr:MAG: hypothetical protein A2Z34_00060 [Planctomycetes bacterium RBG_16_59_8]
MKSGKCIIGPNADLDEGVLLAYLSARGGVDTTLRIGERATIRSGSVIYAGTAIGDRLQTGHGVVIREQNVIGNDVSIWSHSVIDYGCRVGNNILIHNQVYIAQFTIIEDDVFLAPGVKIANDKYPIDKHHLKGPHIGRGAVIGINATLMPGVVIGENAVVGGGSVVTRDVPPGIVVAGSPAKPIGKKSDIYGRKP